MESHISKKSVAFNALLECEPVRNNLYVPKPIRTSKLKPRKHPSFNKSSKMQRLRREREKRIALLEQKFLKWREKCSMEKSAIQDSPGAKTNKLPDPIELSADDINSFTDFIIFDEPVEETINDLKKQVEYELKNTSAIVQKRKNSESFEKEVDNFFNTGDSVAESTTHFQHNSVTDDLNHNNIQMNILQTDSQLLLLNIKKEVDEDETFSSENYDMLQSSIKKEIDSESSFHNGDEILSRHSLHMIDQENTSPLSKNYQTSSSIFPTNVPYTTTYCAGCHAESNENYGKRLFVKLEFQEVNGNEYSKTYLEETDMELMHCKTCAHAREEAKRSKMNYNFWALNTSPKWKSNITDYSRTNKGNSNEKYVTNNLYCLSQDPLLLTDNCKDSQTFLRTSKNLKKKDELKKKSARNNLKKKKKCTKKDCQQLHKNDVPFLQTTVNLEEENFKIRHIFDPDFGKIKSCDIRR